MKKGINGEEELHFEELELDDAANYTCRIGDRETSADLIVEKAESAPYVDPSKMPKDIVIKAGERLEIQFPYEGRYCKSCYVNEELSFPNLPNGFKTVKLKKEFKTIVVGRGVRAGKF